jgi:hypothetical protein
MRSFGFSRYITFTMYLDIVYIYVHSKTIRGLVLEALT